MKELLSILALTLLMGPASGADPPGTGRVLVALGVCNEAFVDRPVLLFRDAGREKWRRLTPPFFGGFDFKDELGGFSIIVEDFSAGQWELYNFEMTSKYIGETRRHKSRNDFSHRFTVKPGVLVDLGRFCAASQATGETFADTGDRVFSTEVKLAYFVVSASRAEDVERARKATGDAAALEVVRARPQPFVVSRLLASGFIEPRLIRKPPVERPMEFPR